MAENPYQPPAGADSEPPPEEGSIAFSDYDLEAVSKATTWMRVVGRLYIFFAVLLVGLGALMAALSGGRILTSMNGVILYSILGAYLLIFILGGTWLGQSCNALYEGVMSDSQLGLAAGFRKLRLYLILYGLIGLVSLAFTILKLVG